MHLGLKLKRMNHRFSNQFKRDQIEYKAKKNFNKYKQIKQIKVLTYSLDFVLSNKYLEVINQYLQP